ncbi:MAG: hypothetical protein RLZZ272_1639 [Actinomycetota bacterium]|jgi:iron(III) transport system substrate-binding protein
MSRSLRHRPSAVLLLLALPVLLVACGEAVDGPTAPTTSAPDASAGGGADADGPLVVYSGRSEDLVGPILEGFAAMTGRELEVRYGDTAELAAAILAEGDASPADVFFGQDAGALGALEAAGRFAELDAETLGLVDPAYRSSAGRWVGVTGRARVLVHAPDLAAADLPDSVGELTDPVWRGRVGWAPTNASFQAFVTALRLLEGEDAARAWVEGMLANDVQVYEKNTAIVEAVGRGEIDLGLTNHYYLLRYLAEDPDYPAVNRFLPGDVGGLVNVAGVGVLSTSERPTGAAELVAHLLSEEVQRSFAGAAAGEYPMRAGVEASDRLPTLVELAPPALDLGRLEDLEGTLALLREVGALD